MGIEHNLIHIMLYYKFQKCLKIRTSRASSPSSIVSEANPCKSGTRKVTIFFSQVQNGHIKRLTDQDIQSSVL